MSRIAVIGAGISGLSAAYYLSRKHEVSLFEREPRLGGHTHTVIVETSEGPQPVDTGFIVHNRRTYPHFCRLIGELGIRTQPSDMSFAVVDGGGAFEYSSRGLGGFFAQRSNLFRPRHYRLLREILRFNREAPTLLERQEASSVSLSSFLKDHKFSGEFAERYLYPIASAVWSTPTGGIGAFPAAMLVRFFQNHGLLAVSGQPPWLTIAGGSHTYIPPLTAPFRDRILTAVEIRAVTRSGTGVRVDIAGRPPLHFDDVVFACHGNQILPLLADASEHERDVLSKFRTTRNEASLHTHARLLPRRRRARASWNFHLGERGQAVVTYHMNRLQSLTTREQYCVTLNAGGELPEDRVLKRMVYYHPVFDQAAIGSQQRWGEISGRRRTHFCGAYWFYGFHEDGVRSALRVAASLGVEPS